jgi:peroxiredoxin
MSSARRTAVGFLFAALLTGCERSSSQAREAGPSPTLAAAERPAAPAFSLSGLDGNKVSLGDFKGHPVFLEFWATWCGPCRVSIPEVEKLHEEYAAKGLRVVSISQDEDAEGVPRFVKRRGMTYPVLLDSDGRVGSRYGVRGIPAFFLIDAGGRVAGAWDGFSERFPRQWRRAADAILTEKA